MKLGEINPIRKLTPFGQPDSFANCVHTNEALCLVGERARQVIITMKNDDRLSRTVTVSDKSCESGQELTGNIIDPERLLQREDVVHTGQKVEGLIKQENMPRLRFIIWIERYHDCEQDLRHYDDRP